MKTHPLHPQIAMPERLSDLRITRYQGNICLTDEEDIYIGAVFKSKELDAIAKSFNYNASGYDSLLSGPAFKQRIPLANYEGHLLQGIRQGNPPENGKLLDIAALDLDLSQYQEKWTNTFNKFAWEVGALAGNNYEIRIACLQFEDEWFHHDEDVVGILPCKDEESDDAIPPSTICMAANGEVLRFYNGELVITTPLLQHSWPSYSRRRAGLGFTVYSKDIS